MELPYKYKKNKIYSHESPDGGNTVYAREHGSNQRHLVYKSENSLIEEESQMRTQYVNTEAVKLCRQNKGLQKAWEKYIVLLKLSGFNDE
jgi:hypothetical protein